MTLQELNALPLEAFEEEIGKCCGARTWIESMAKSRPFASESALFDIADRVWRSLSPKDWLEAFLHHPRIGDTATLRAKFAPTASWASQEQSGTQAAPEAVIEALANGNREYEARFGFIFIVCATGKSAEEMLAILQTRLKNEHKVELELAALEQSKITRIRLEKLLTS